MDCFCSISMVFGDDGIATDAVIINKSITTARKTTMSSTEAEIVRTHL